MTYRIARNGETYGPYTEAEVRRYLRSGHIAFTDFVLPEGAANWVPLTQLFPPATQPQQTMMPLRTGYPDPPDLPWWVALLLGLLTGGVFFVAWDVVEAAWLRRLERSSTALLLYLAVAALYVVKIPWLWSMGRFHPFGNPFGHAPSFGVAGIILAITARFLFRRELLDHFNQREGIALRLNGFWTLIFGGLYFQYHFNRINEVKRAMRAVPMG